MKKTIGALLLAMMLLWTFVSFAEEARTLTQVLNDLDELMFATRNLSLTGEAIFSLEGERFKSVAVRYVQDGESSLRDIKLSAPRPAGKEMISGYTMITEGSRRYVIETLHPRLYQTRTVNPSHTVLRDSAPMNLMRALAKEIVEKMESTDTEAVSVISDVSKATVTVELQGSVPAWIQNGANVLWNYAAKRYRDNRDENTAEQKHTMSEYQTDSKAILYCTESISVEKALIHIQKGIDGYPERIAATAVLRLTTAQDGDKLLDVAGYVILYDKGTSAVRPFSAREYDVKLADGFADFESGEYAEITRQGP